MEDDLPQGLRSSTPVNYSPAKKHNDVAPPATEKKVQAKPQAKAEVIPPEVQAMRDNDAVAILNAELVKAEAAAKSGDPRAAADVAGLKREIQRATSKSPMANANPSLTASAADEVEHDEAPSLREATNVNYNVAPVASEGQQGGISDRTKAEMGVGALTGAYVANRRRKAENTAAQTASASMMHLPLDQRPMDAASLQRYINSQFSVSIPVDKLEELTGMPVRTMREVQEARRVVEGSPASREPVVKDVNGRRTTVSYRNVPAQAPLDISAFAAQEPTFMSKVGNAISGGARNFANTAMNWARPIAGGMVAAPQLMEAGTDYARNKPVDPTQVLSGVGGLAMMSRTPVVSQAGALAQLPYAIKHRDEIARSLSWHDVNPTAFPIGSPGADEPFIPPR